MTLPPIEEDTPAILIAGPKLPQHLQKLVDLLPLGEKVHRATIEASYGKSNYARRIRKIVAEYGWDIERFRGSAGANDDWYIRRSEGPVRIARIRREVAPPVRQIVYARDNWVCQMCGVEVSTAQTLTRAQCDHKVPAERGGSSAPNNLQTLCLQCNLKKRQACGHCDLPTCANCPYAFPEQFVETLILKLSPESAQKLVKLSDQQGIPPGTVVKRLIDQS